MIQRNIATIRIIVKDSRLSDVLTIEAVVEAMRVSLSFFSFLEREKKVVLTML